MAYAIFEACGRQFRAEAGDSIRMPLMNGDPGTKLTFDQVLLTADGDKVKTGQPMVTGAKVLGEIVEHGKERKIYVFKFKRRKNYKRKTGHRQQYTEVKITDLKLG
ncbi:MAG: 50S ribosomal protein L21 [Gemmatimonadetes bacterium]|nr:50S ribosomal protein L21 [Gemmatimonadota bacterium]